MNSGGLGVGSASIILIFAVLSLTVFSLITFYVAENDKVLVDAKADSVVSFYEADAQAEAVLAQIMSSDVTPGETVSFMTPISDISALYVSVLRTDYAFEILSWKMIMIDDWSSDDTLNVWPGT